MNDPCGSGDVEAVMRNEITRLQTLLEQWRLKIEELWSENEALRKALKASDAFMRTEIDPRSSQRVFQKRSELLSNNFQLLKDAALSTQPTEEV